MARGRLIEGKNGQVRAFGEPRETRQNKKESKKGAAPLEPPCTPRVLRAASLLEPSSTARTPRLICYSSPVPKILPLALLTPAQEEVQEWQERLLLDDDTTEEDTLNDVGKVTASDKEDEKETAPQQDNVKEPVPHEDIPDTELEARFGLLEAIVTSHSQTVPDFSNTINLDSNDTALSSDESDDERGVRSYCHKCKYDDKSAAAMLAHKKNTHIEDVFPCQICEFEASRKDELKKHIEEHQAMNRRCELCGECCTNASNLQKHIVAKHCKKAADKPIDCESCGKSCPTVASLQTHLLSVHGSQSDRILELLTNHTLVMSSIQQQIHQMNLSQNCVSKEITEIKEGMLRNHVSLERMPATAPRVPAPAPCVPALPPGGPAVTSYAAAAGEGAAAGAGAARSRQVRPAPTKISFVTDSIGHHVNFAALEKLTKTKTRRGRPR